MQTCTVCNRSFTQEPHIGRPTVTCSTTCQRQRKNAQSKRSRQRAAAHGCPPGLHGTMTGYSHYLCGCYACLKWAREYKAERRRIRKEASND